MPTTISGTNGVDNIQDGLIVPADLNTAVNPTIQRIMTFTPIVAANQTSIDFTGIPSWAKEITVTVNGLSTNGSSNIQMQIGTGSGIDITGYASTAFDATSATATTGFVLTGSVAGANVRSGSVTLTLSSGNTWVSSGVISRTDAAQGGFSSGNKTLSATLDRIRITTVNGTDQFDAGSVSILVKG